MNPPSENTKDSPDFSDSKKQDSSRTVKVVRRVCLMAPSPGLGGSERALLDLAFWFHQNPDSGFKPWVLLPDQGPALDWLKTRGIETDVLKLPKSFININREAPLQAFQNGLLSIAGMSVYLGRLALLLGKRRPALLHTFGIWCHGIGGTIGPLARIPVLWNLREIFEEGPTLWTLRTLQKATGIYVSASCREVAVSYTGSSVIDPRIPVVLQGIDRKIEPVQTSVRPILRVGIVGSLKKAKGQEDFIAMASQLIRETNGKLGDRALQFIVAGTRQSAAFEIELKSLVSRLGLDRFFEFTGYQEDLSHVLRSLDVLVYCPRPAEGSSRVLAEAQAHGVPTVAVEAGVSTDLIDAPHNGLFFEMGNISQMAQGVRNLLESQDLRRQISERAQARFTERLSLDQVGKTFTRIYANLAKPSGDPRVLVKRTVLDTVSGWTKFKSKSK